MGRTLPDGSPTRGFDPRRGYSMVTLDVEGVTGLPVTPPKFLERPTGFEPATSSLGIFQPSLPNHHAAPQISSL